jgi:predicted RNase H-like nuclease (RuvC/YqgF family)
MGRIGKKKKAKAGAKQDDGQQQSDAYQKQIKGLQAVQSSNPGGGFSEQDVEFMKKAIQVLCQSTNPLGKSIDYVSDDVDSMSKEYEHWRKEAIQCTADLEEQKKITDEVIQPLQHQLAELEEKIREQQSKVTSMRS